MKNFTNSFRKGEKGQVLVLVGLSLVALVAIIGLALDTGYMYVSYARLQRAVDAAALGATSEFKRNYNIAELKAAAKQMLYMNLAGEFTEDAGSEFSDIQVVTCDTVAADHGIPKDQMKARITELIGYDRSPYVCTDPLRKMVRVKVTQTLKTFFISIAGITQVPVTIEALAEAATVDVVMAIDTSESMSLGWNRERVGDDADPSQCNVYKTCLPFEDVKSAAKLFLNNLYFPYDRVGIVTFDKDAALALPLSDSFADIENAIDSLKVFEAIQACNWTKEERTLTREDYPAVYGDALNPCRLYNNTGEYQSNFECAGFWGLTPDGSACPSTNTADGIALGGAILTGDYTSTGLASPPSGGTWPAVRDESLWVLLLLTDGAPNSGHDENGSRLCPNSERGYTWVYAGHSLCRDNDTLTRHCWSNADVDCMNAAYPKPEDYPGLTVQSIVDQSMYDADDRARDMFDLVSRNSTLIFTIGMGSQTLLNKKPDVDINGIAPGTTVLKYGAYGTTNDMTNPNAYKGLYYFGNNSGDLTRIFLTIANNLATRINQ